VKKAIQDAEGNLTRAAARLGCTRQTLYTWIYQHGLDRLAGIRMDRRTRLDSADRLDSRTRKGKKETKSGVYSAPDGSPTLKLVEQMAQPDLPIQATLKVRESLWKRMKIAAISRGCTLASLAEMSFERTLAEEEQTKKTRNKRGEG